MPWILSFGFIFSILGSFSKVLGFIFYLPTWLLISYFLKIMDFFSQSWMSKVITNVPIIWLIIFYIGIAFVTIILNKKYSGKFI
jgi:hypothetical protein